MTADCHDLGVSKVHSGQYGYACRSDTVIVINLRQITVGAHFSHE